ncbi:type I phosphomannose isomerase catalytic subunit [Mycoplasmoides pirum]|uniref:type I phosphomannose isomerase catalytic subunit n=1 Tax=Mycoplasmoides pirum TaxID=2122 RepID=UPI0005682F9F|nr:type I phosphomannose isomerase catalytic subunit [Mycoplasmoides pirum]
MQPNILILKPYIQEKVWGGNRLKDYGYECLYDNRNGEAWLISAIENKSSIVVNANDVSLLEYYNNHQDFFNNYNKPYPLLVKIIDANDDLSVQVHPNDEYAFKKHNQYGKWECWYVLDCNNNANVVYGHNAKNKEELTNLINQKEWNKLLVNKPIKIGDVIDVPPGTVHAIKSSSLIYELQQSSDITYRLFDYDRLDNNQPRTLHIEDSINTIYYPQDNLKIQSGLNNASLINNEKFKLEKINNINRNYYLYDNAHWIQGTVIEGNGLIDDIEIKKGSNFIVKHNHKFCLNGNMQILISYVSIN